MPTDKGKQGRRIPDGVRAEIVKARQGGTTIKDLMGKFKLAKSTIERITREGGVMFRPSRTGTARDTNPELADLLAARQEIQERIKEVYSRTTLRQRLWKFVMKHGFTRADVRLVYDKLPKERITRKDRLARLAATKKGGEK